MQSEVKEVLDACKADLEKAIEHQKNEYMVIRAGRANPHLLDKIFIDYYGAPTPLNNMASINVPEARTITVQVWDQSQVKNVIKAIAAADLGINPSDDGKVIRLTFPPLTEERRKEIAKDVRKIAEETKIAVRAARRDALEMLKDYKKESVIGEDEYSAREADVQKFVDEACSRIDEISKAKEKEIMEV